MDKKFTFKKEVTRDLALLAIQGFQPALMRLYEKLKGSKANSPFMIFYTKKLLVEEWLDSDLLKEFVELLLVENSKDSSLLENGIRDYQKHLDSFKNPDIQSVQQLQEYLQSLYTALEGFIIFYFTAGDARTPLPVFELAKKVRDLDTIGDTSDKIVRAVLKNLFPHTEGYETVISFNDLSSMPTLKILKERAEDFLFIPEVVSEIINLGNFSKKHPEYFFQIEVPNVESLILNGQIGNKGYTKGIVRILNRKQDIGDMKEGEIIVSTMTTPDFIPAMNKAAAIVTDEGGITCHAAIVARELNKPCVIGTKFASQILKNGDEIEVDANKGIVKIIKKA